MKSAYVTPNFETEAALCQAFILTVPEEWIVYPETCGWDILLVHRQGGWQIGIEAKLTLNAKVLVQAIEGRSRGTEGPDLRAVLVGKAGSENSYLAATLGLTVIAPEAKRQEFEWPGSRGHHRFGPKIPTFRPMPPEAAPPPGPAAWVPSWMDRETWFDEFPTQRHRLPDYIPEVKAGVPSPMILSNWKIKAMRVCIWVMRNGSINRAQFRALGIDPSRWMTGVWLKAGVNRGEWVPGSHFPAAQMRREHPGVFAQVEADYGKWAADAKLIPSREDAQ